MVWSRLLKKRVAILLIASFMILYGFGVFGTLCLNAFAPPMCPISEGGKLEIKAERGTSHFAVVEVVADGYRCLLNVSAGRTYKLDLNATRATVYAVAAPMGIGVTYATPTVAEVTSETSPVTVRLEKYEWYSPFVAFLSLFFVVMRWLKSPPTIFRRYWRPKISARQEMLFWEVSIVFNLPIVCFLSMSMFDYILFNYGMPYLAIMFLSSLVIPNLISILIGSEGNNPRRPYGTSKWDYLYLVWIQVVVLLVIFGIAFYIFSIIMLLLLQIAIPRPDIAFPQIRTDPPPRGICMLTSLLLIIIAPVIYFASKGVQWAIPILNPLAVDENLARERLRDDVFWHLVLVGEGGNEIPAYSVYAGCVEVLSDDIDKICGADLRDLRLRKIDLWQLSGEKRPVEIRVVPLGSTYVTKLFIKAKKCKTDITPHATERFGDYIAVTAVGKEIKVACVANAPIEPAEATIYSKTWETPYIRLAILGDYPHQYGYPLPTTLTCHVEKRRRHHAVRLELKLPDKPPYTDSS